MLTVLGLGVGGYAVASAATNQLSVCVSKDGGMRFIVTGFTKKQTCEKGEQLISWNSAGQQGPQGISGAQGPKGDKGNVGKVLRVKGADGADLGSLVSLTRRGSGIYYSTYYESANVFLQMSNLTPSNTLGDGEAYYPSMFAYEGLDCAGSPYVLLSDNGVAPQQVFSIPSNNNNGTGYLVAPFYSPDFSSRASRALNSFMDASGCKNEPQAGESVLAIELNLPGVVYPLTVSNE